MGKPKNKTNEVPLNKRYTLGEEIFNSVSHGVGALLAIAGTVVLIVISAIYSDPWGIVSSAIYGATLIILYTMSTLYHALTNEKAKHVMRIMDHATIFLLIAGTYTPITLVSLRGVLGWVLFGFIWAAAIVGIVLNAIDLERFRKISVVCYIVMGWTIIVAIVPLIKSMSSLSLILLLAGGIMYSVGVIFYAIKKIRYFHSIWHLFTVGGSVLHYFAILTSFL
ncbi:MAG: hemolysin III family protein [Acutalibacteraceae bacterium]|nr:hemolysin III family protein [Acutalibacteraceae bacterium]